MIKKPVVAHSVHAFLPLTCNWIYNLLINFKRFKPIVITRVNWHSNSFPFDDVYSWDDFSGVNQFVQRVYKRILSLNYLPFEYQLLKKKETKLLHSHFGDLGYKNLGLKKRLKIPQIVSFYGYDLSLISKDTVGWKEKYKELFSTADVFLVEGKYSKMKLIELGCHEDKIVVQHIGVNVDKIEFSPRKINNDGTIKILIASSFLEKKGIPYALEAVGRISKRYHNLKTVIIGDTPKINPQGISEKNKILDAIDKFKLTKNMVLLGYQPYDVFLKEAKEAHIFIAPSIHASDGDSEGGVPVAIIEMSASGIPIVATAHCDIPEVVIDGKNGFLVPEKDSEALADKLEYLIEHQEIWESMGKFGREYIEEHYNIKNQIVQLENIYTKLLT